MPATSGPRHRPTIQPLVLLTLDEQTSLLGGAVALALGTRQPHALPFFCSLALDARGDRADRIHRAFQAVTDLGERETALLTGNAIEDRIRVVLAFLMGSPAIEDVLLPALEQVHRIGGNFFDQTPIEVHALAFLPDLGPTQDRGRRYEEAYRQLCLLDSMSASAATRGARLDASIDYRWLFDCRTHSGAYAGSLEDVLEPAARLVTLLLDSEADGLHSAGSARESALSATALGRQTAYSSFGGAMLFHQPEMLARALAARAAVLHLATYAMTGAPASTNGTAREDRDDHDESPEQAAARVTARLQEFAERAGLQESFEDPVAEDAEGIARASARRRRSERFEREAVASVRTWLAERGIGFAMRVLRAADGSIREGEEPPVMAPGLSHASLRIEWRFRVRSFLGVDDADTGDIDDFAWRTLIDDDVDPHALQHALETFAQDRAGAATSPHDAPELEVSPPEGETRARLGQGDAAQDVPGVPAPHPRSQASALDRLLGWLRHREAEPAPAPPPAPERIATAPAPAPPPRRDSPRRLAEQKRWLDDYAALLQRLRAALGSHTADLTRAADYYRNVATHLERAISARTNFRLPVLTKSDIERYAAEYVPALRDALRERADADRLASLFSLDATPPDPDATATEPLARFDARLAEVTDAVLKPVLDETLAAVLAGRGKAPARFAPADLLRMMLEASEPLVRPWSIETVAAPVTSRWIIAHESLHEWLAQDDEAAAILEDAGVLRLGSTSSGSFSMGAALHGFPAFAVQKVRELRAHAAVRGPARSSPYADVVPLEVARTQPSSERVFRTLVIARALELIAAENHRVAFRDTVVTGDLLDLEHAIAFEAGHRGLEAEIDAEVGRALAQTDGLDRLRRALRDDGLAPAERRIVLEVIADLDAQRAEAPHAAEADPPALTAAQPEDA